VRQALGERDRLNRRTADVETRNHARDAHARHCNTRSAMRAGSAAEAA
jgi:hypothetical protein